MSVCTAQDGWRVGMRNGGDPSAYGLLLTNVTNSIKSMMLQAAARVSYRSSKVYCPVGWRHSLACHGG